MYPTLVKDLVIHIPIRANLLQIFKRNLLFQMPNWTLTVSIAHYQLKFSDLECAKLFFKARGCVWKSEVKSRKDPFLRLKFIFKFQRTKSVLYQYFQSLNFINFVPAGNYFHRFFVTFIRFKLMGVRRPPSLCENSLVTVEFCTCQF